MPSIPSWNEELVFEGVNYIMDSSNGVLYSPETEQEVGQWEANYGYSVPDNCGGYVTWVDYHAEDQHDADVSRSMALSCLQEQIDAATMIQKYARRMIVMNMESPVDPTGFEPIPDPAEPELDLCSAMQMWPEASQSMLRRDFKEAARGFREAYEKSRGWHEDDSVPFTTHQQLLLELILQAEVWAMNEPH
jgi:hypothetical protein